ncbi:SDR family oxidoreductase [Nocardioides sp. CN2-186]|uniref:SDR family oxidoreductase n=1 Tax=Nocardioides tweenelious TaxID=3156607 RepID=UPI0032B5F769
MITSHSPRVVVITGASGGIGRASARVFAARGDRVALLARGTTGLEAAASEVRALGGTALPISVDTADHDALEVAADRVENELGPIDVWVNDAFTSVFARFIDIKPDEFRRVTEVSYLGFVNGTRTALRRMLPRDQGVIVQVGSALAHRGIPLQSAYCGAKHAMWGFHESLLTELRHDRSSVRVTSVAMPGVNTPQFTWVLSKLPKQAQPVPPFYAPEVAARGVLYAAEHPERRAYWVGIATAGTIIANRVAGGLLDRYLARTGVSSQQTAQDKPADKPNNLWHPVDGPDGQDFGPTGPFPDRALNHSPQQWASQHRRALAATGALALGMTLVAGRTSRSPARRAS